MSDLEEQLSRLSPRQRALLELRLQERRSGGTAVQTADPDAENLVLAKSVDSVDGLLAQFYGRYPWPWPAQKFDILDAPDFETVMVNQDVGDWSHATLPRTARIWVAGCGVNQAVATALRFSRAEVVGSDVSVKSLELCGRMAAQLGISNLELREESINHVGYDREFDYVISTGVIHHNADPAVTLERIAAAMKPHGILELMVYNRFHRIVTSAFQKAVRIFGEAREAKIDFEREVALAGKLVENLPVKDLLEKAFTQYMAWSESDFADLLVQPVEHSYTVESLEDLARGCGLEFALPCISSYAKHLATNIFWNLELADPELREEYFALPDSRRWQVTNLLLHDRSPLLWFYFQRAGARCRRSEREVCEEFLDRCFERCGTLQRSFLRGEDGSYSQLPTPVVYPMAQPGGLEREIAEAAGPERPMREVLRLLGVDLSFPTVDRVRNRLTTSAFPYLWAVE